MSTNDSSDQASQSSDLMMQIFQGVIQKELGLSMKDLDVALGVANMKLRSGDPMNALQIYTALILCNPSHYDFQCGLANCTAQIQEHDLTIQAASAMIALDPQDPRGYYFSAVGCIGMGHFEEALEDIQDARHFAELSENKSILSETDRLFRQMDSMKN